MENLDLRVRSNNKQVAFALREYCGYLEKLNHHKYTLSEAIVEMIKEQLVDGQTSRLRRVEEQMNDLHKVVLEQMSSENILIYTLVNGHMPESKDGEADEIHG